MSPLYKYLDKIIIKDGKLGATQACCCNKFEYTIEICNINAITDDDWRVDLNGKNIGTHKAPLMILAGTVWRTNRNLEVGCGQVDYKTISKTDFNDGPNKLRMEITKLYECGGGDFEGFGCGNFGTVTVNRWKFDQQQNKYVVDVALLSGEYSAPSEIGFVLENFDFNYP